MDLSGRTVSCSRGRARPQVPVRLQRSGPMDGFHASRFRAGRDPSVAALPKAQPTRTNLPLYNHEDSSVVFVRQLKRLPEPRRT